MKADRLHAGSRRRLIRDPRGWLASGFGLGFSPIAPGTIASAAALLPWWWWLHELPVAAYFGVLLAAFLLGLGSARWTIREARVDDPPLLVWDEVVGMWLALWMVPAEWPWVLAAFLLFRCIDIAKPWPVGWVDRHCKGGLGAMLDDALAGLITFALLQAALWAQGAWA